VVALQHWNLHGPQTRFTKPVHIVVANPVRISGGCYPTAVALQYLNLPGPQTRFTKPVRIVVANPVHISGGCCPAVVALQIAGNAHRMFPSRDMAVYETRIAQFHRIICHPRDNTTYSLQRTTYRIQHTRGFNYSARNVCPVQNKLIEVRVIIVDYFSTAHMFLSRQKGDLLALHRAK